MPVSTAQRVARWATLPFDLPGALVLVPLVVLLFGSHWASSRRLVPTTGSLLRAQTGQPVEVGIAMVREGARATRGLRIGAGESLTIEMPELRHAFTLAIQGRGSDSYEVTASGDGSTFASLWTVPEQGGSGLRARRRSFDRPLETISALRVTPLNADSSARFSGLEVTYTALYFRHLYLIPILWGLWLLLQLSIRLPPLRSFGERLLSFWRRVDSWFAAVLIVSIVFELRRETLILAAILLVVLALVRLCSRHFRRAPLVFSAYLAFLGLFFFYLVPRLIGMVVAGQVASLHDFTVDHRPRADGNEINRDGIRFRNDSSSLHRDDFVVLMLGDSFTYGLRLAYDQTFPYVVEQILGSSECSQPVRVVNMGWTSSSPLLGLRLLRQVGAKYRPDLVLYALDMTDFHDDLRYELELRRTGDLEIPDHEIAQALLRSLVSRIPIVSSLTREVTGLLRHTTDSSSGPESPEASLPRDRFFATSQSLEESRDGIERGVMSNLAKIHSFAASELGAQMGLIVYPRAYQYSSVESQHNWEGHRYQTRGPYVREPFRYLDESAPQLPYPVLSLLSAFEDSETFPLFLDDDPHWNPSGARLAAETTARLLVEAQLVPCRP